MSDAATQPAPTEATTPPAAETKAAAPEVPAKPDPKAEVNEKLKGLGLKLKAKDREVPVSSLDDLVSRANRVFGVETLLEEAKTAKSEAESVKAWKAAMEADDPAAAQDAFEALSPKAQRNALQWMQRKAAEAQEEESLSEREREMRRTLEAQQRQLREYHEKEAEAQRQRLEAEAQAELARTRDFAAGIAQKALEGLKAPVEMAPSLLPRVARVLRVAMEAGVEVTPEEVANEVRDSMVSEARLLTQGMDGEGVIALLGDELAVKVARAYLARRRQAAPTQAQVQALNGEVKPQQANNEDAALRGSLRFFR